MAEPTPRLLEPKFIEPFSTCASCIESLDDLDWVASSTFRVGEWALGVRSSNVETDAALRRILAAHVVDLAAPANFSALMADGSNDSDGTDRTFNFVYTASDALVRTRAPGRAVRTLLHHLSDFADSASTTLRIGATGFVADGQAVIVPDRIRTELSLVESRLNARGLAVIDAPVLHVDPASGALVVPEPVLTVDIEALAEFERTHPPSRPERQPVAPGRYRIAAWGFTTDENRLGPLGTAAAVAAAAQEVVNAEAFGAQGVLDIVAAVFDATPAFGMSWDNPATLTAQLLELFEGGRAVSTHEHDENAAAGDDSDDIRPDAIDDSFVPRARPDVAAVLVDHEIVLGRIAPGTTYMDTCALNESGSIVWQCFDGTGTIAEIAADIAEVYKADLAAVTDDVLSLARDVGAVGFLFGVSDPAIEIGSEPGGLEVGELFPDFAAATEAGTPTTMTDLRGRATLLINWSTTCQYCGLIVDDLAELAPRLTNAGVELVLLATGGARANRDLLDRHLLAARLLLQDEDAALGFDGAGTPVAYLLDERGWVAQPRALGSTEVVDLARLAAGVQRGPSRSSSM